MGRMPWATWASIRNHRDGHFSKSAHDLLIRSMGFLKRILRAPQSEAGPLLGITGTFETLSQEELRAHMSVSWYGTFELTDAIRPAYQLDVVPRQGFRHDRYRDEASGADIPVLMAAATKSLLLDLFLDLLEPLGPIVDVVLESSHRGGRYRPDLHRGQIDLPVLRSVLLEHEHLLLNDGCTGIAVVCPDQGQEVQLDEHKTLIVYGEPLENFAKILIDSDVYPDPQIRFVTEAEHIHSSNRRFLDEFDRLCTQLAMGHHAGDEAAGW